MIASLAGIALQIIVTVAAPDTITVRQPATLTVRAVVRGPVAPTIHPPRFAPLNGFRVEESTRVDGAMSQAIVEHRYLVVAERPGVVVLPPIEANVGPMTGRSAPVRLTIINAPPVQVPAVVSRSRLDPDAGVNFHALVTPDTVYVGEQATYQVGVFLNDDVRYRLRRNPEFIPPELRSMLAYDLSAPRSFVSKRVVDGRHYEVHVFQRALFPLTAGRYDIPAARLNYSLPLSASFFSREESHQLKSETVPLVVIDPPETGRPADFSGAVGRLSLEAHVDSGTAKVGDPLVLTVRVTGDGNVSFFPRPEVRVPWGQLVPAEERVQLDSSATVVRGAKEFDWVITPARSGEVEVPQIRYPFFNPYTERYELAVTTPQRVSVAPGTLVAMDSADSARPVLPLAPRHARRAAGAALDNTRVLGRDAHRADSGCLGACRAPPSQSPRADRRGAIAKARAASSGGHARGCQRVATYVRRGARRAHRCRRRGAGRPSRARTCTPDEMASPPNLRARPTSCSASSIPPCTLPLRRASRTGPGEPSRFCVVSNEEARPRIVTRSSRSLASVAMLGLTLGVAQSEPTARESFDHGSREYEARRFARAERFFADAARADPTSPDAWANFGTAAWAARDTAAAAIGWQRALRLDPLSGDVRSRLDLTPGFGGSALANVPPLTESTAAAIGGGAWLLGWLVLAVGIWRRKAAFRYAAYVLGIVAVASAIAGVRVREAFEARRLAVVVDADRLRSLPVLGERARRACAHGRGGAHDPRGGRVVTR